MFLDLPDNHQSITDREQHILNAVVGEDHFVKIVQSLRVFISLIQQNSPAPEHIVGDDEAAGTDLVENNVVITAIIRFVGVDKYQVKWSVQIRNQIQRG